MFSSARPTLSLLGESSLVGEANTPRYLPYAERMDHLASLGMIGRDDPRMNLDPQSIRSLGVRSLEGLQNAAAKAYAIQRSENPLSTRESTDKSSVVRAAIAASLTDTPETADTDPSMGHAGILARRLEEAALRIAAMDAKDPNVTRLLCVAAAAHNLGASDATLKGFENGSIVEAAATQRRDPLAVLADMTSHGHLDPTDPRRKIKESDMDITAEDALQRIRSTRPSLTQDATAPADTTINTVGVARRAEGRAMAMLGQTGGTPFEQETRAQDGHRLLVGAFTAERHRQQEALAARVAKEITPPKRVSVFGRSEAR